MKIIKTACFTALAFLVFSCGAADPKEGSEVEGNASSTNSSENIATEPDYEDTDANQNGRIDYQESSASSTITARSESANFTNRADSLQNYGDTLVTPTYTDDEYEAAYSTSTTNPKNQVEGGVKPGKKN